MEKDYHSQIGAAGTQPGILAPSVAGKDSHLKQSLVLERPLASPAPPEQERDQFPTLGDTPPHRRTPGLRLLDVFIYPVVNNLAVFGISVFATYLTSKGGMRNAEGELIYGKVGEFFHKRGEVLKEWLKGKGLNEEQADMAKMVAFSFGDGTVMAPVVKLLEDNREHIGKSIDEVLGTVPDDESVYQAEPKQTWRSVLGGRLLTAGIVVPTAVALDKAGLNKVLFNDPGEKIGKILHEKPFFAKHESWLDIKEISRVSVFEAFYTSVCTAGLYFSSRILARVPGFKSVLENDTTTPPQDDKPAAAQIPVPHIERMTGEVRPSRDPRAPNTQVIAHESHAERMQTKAELAL